MKVEGKLTVVLDGEEDHLVLANKVEQQVFAKDELPKVVTRADEPPKAAAGGAGFQRSGRVIEERAARLGKLAERGDEVVEEAL